MSRTHPLRWYQQLRWKLPVNYLLLTLAPIAVMLSASSVLIYLEYESVYTPATFVRLASARASSAGALLASPPVSRAAAEILLDDVDEDLVTLGDRDPRSDLSNVSDASV